MFSRREALAALKKINPLPGSEEVALADAAGRVLAEDVMAACDLPPFPASLFDGYACRSADTARASGFSPVSLKVVARIGAGGSYRGLLAPGEAVRVMTGAPLPAGADTVVPFEAVTVEGTLVTIRQQLKQGWNIAAAGSDFAAGERLLAAGSLLTPGHLGLLAASGRAAVKVKPRPRLSVLSCGSELAQPGGSLPPGQIYESNSIMISALAAACGADVIWRGSAPDCPRRLAGKITGALAASDVVVTSGGVSGGDYDHTAEVVLSLGAEKIFHRVALAPGGQALAAVLGNKPVFCLTGKPTGAFVSFHLFVRPALFRLQGRPGPDHDPRQAMVTEEVVNNRGVELCLPATVCGENGQWLAAPLSRGKGILSLGAANALIILPPGPVRVAAGSLVTVLQL